MTWYQRSRLVSKLFRDLASGPNSAKFSSALNQLKTGFSRCSTACSRFEARLNRPMSSDTKKRFKMAMYCGVAAAITTCFHNVELTPYNRRPHVVLVPRYLEKKLGEYKIRKMKEEFKEDVLPPEHPLTERVSLITRHLAEAEYRVPHALWSVKAPTIAEQFPEFLNWEVIVIDRPIVKVCCYGAKIVIFTGLLDRLESDAEIATVIGHEVGHDLARHAAEKLTKQPWYSFRKHFLYIFFDWEDQPIQPCFRKIEREADLIGLMMMASAGYDPRVAPSVYTKLTYDRVWSDYCSEYPTANKRAQLLARPEVMQNAVAAYELWRAGGFEEFSKRTYH